MSDSALNFDTDVLDALEGTEKRKYYLARLCPELDHIAAGGSSSDVVIMWNMYGVVAFSIKEEWVRELGRLTKSYEEVTENVGRWGVKHFGEIRAVVKVTSEDPLSTSDEYAVSVTGPKTAIELPKERIDAAIAFMKVSAKLIIEDQYDRKFLSLKCEVSKLEQFLWDAQVRESNNLEGETPVLDSIAAAKGEKVADVAASVLANQTAFKDKVILLNAEMLKVKTEFKNCATIKELNLLWQKYMGIPMPNDQMLELGQVHEEEGALTTDTVEAGLHL